MNIILDCNLTSSATTMPLCSPTACIGWDILRQLYMMNVDNVPKDKIVYEEGSHIPLLSIRVSRSTMVMLLMAVPRDSIFIVDGHPCCNGFQLLEWKMPRYDMLLGEWIERSDRNSGEFAWASCEDAELLVGDETVLVRFRRAL